MGGREGDGNDVFIVRYFDFFDTVFRVELFG